MVLSVRVFLLPLVLAAGLVLTAISMFSLRQQQGDGSNGAPGEIFPEEFKSPLSIFGAWQIYILPIGFYSCLLSFVFSIRFLLRKLRVLVMNPHLPLLIPGGLPFVGNVFGFDRKKPHLAMTELVRKHGDVYRLRLFGEDIVVVSNAELIREGLTNPSFAGRPAIFRIKYGFHYCDDIIFGTYSEKWQSMKKTALEAVKLFGGGRHDDELITREMTGMLHHLNDLKGVAFDPSHVTLTSVVNAITAMMLGKRYEYDDPLMAEYKLITRLFSESCSLTDGLELDIFPLLRFLPNESFRKLQRARALLDKYIDRELHDVKCGLESRCATPRPPRCVMEYVLTQVALVDNKHIEDRDEADLTLEDARAMFIDILVSGTLTTSIALTSFVLYMATNPEIQHQARAEVQSVLGNSRIPHRDDREKMPYMQAIILEILRLISHVPTNLPHYTLNDTRLGEYDILQKTQVLFNLWSLHHDDRYWENPWTFDPTRFLDDDGELLPANHKIRKCLLPFGAGRRMCIGEALAKERLLLFASCIINNFDISCDTDNVPSQDPRSFLLGLILEPPPFTVKMNAIN